MESGCRSRGGAGDEMGGARGGMLKRMEDDILPSSFMLDRVQSNVTGC